MSCGKGKQTKRVFSLQSSCVCHEGNERKTQDSNVVTTSVSDHANIRYAEWTQSDAAM
jgi:hypothetical protein